MINLNKGQKDILDDEIRIISPTESQPDKPSGDDRKPRFPWWGWLIAVLAVALVAVLFFFMPSTAPSQDTELGEAEISGFPVLSIATDSVVNQQDSIKPFTSLTDTVICDRKLTILKPENAKASLVIGDSILDVEGPVLVAQAADVRGDNGEIAGAYVIDGEMKSRGKAKSGFCAIIGNEITIGIAETTPLLEKATEENGYFFRQYPLLYEGEIIENKIKAPSQRKALATLNDEVVVILSHDRLTFHDFSQALAHLGVKNAIYLVGSTAYLKAKLEDGRIYEFGKREADIYPNTNYIVWQ